ncbi:MAG: hypothetical protein AMS27_01600 [Bacteroides sp. SM23_62_1]|nr:MAG: hypothetical protein AMS27_01600 [Bacteroides sp. SM23_62_1]
MKSIIITFCLFFLIACDTGNISVKIDTEKTQEPISEYIYGQFIEHLGRCIYDGIWAEMIEDRKFYYPVKDDYNPWATDDDPYWKAGEYLYLAASPWKVIGSPGTVIMDTLNPFVGKHTPVIHLPGDGTTAGIAQESIAITEGNNYTGRIILAGDKSALPVIVQLVMENGDILSWEIGSITPEYHACSLEFTAPSTDKNVQIQIISKGKGQFRIGIISLMPADNISGWRKNVVALMKELNAPVYRWPGGNFVSGYDWKDGIGNRDQRPPRKNPAWKGVEHNDVGIHEYMELMQLLGSEPFVAVNTGLGTVDEVAEQVEYCNSTADSPMGTLRAQNGHPEPYGVKWWAVGNEMYGSWQLGHMPLEEYVKKHNSVARAMWNIDPTIKLIGVGEVGEWSETMLRICSDNMSLISEHIYCQELEDVSGHTRQLARQIKYKADAHRKYRDEIEELKGKDIRIAMDEWNYWYGDYLYGELGVRYHHKDGLGVAIGLHEYFRNSDIYFMANYAQTVNVIGCIKTTKTDAGFATTALPLILYHKHFGTVPIEITGRSKDIDIAAALTRDGKALTVAIVNPNETTRNVSLDFGETQVNEEGAKWIIHHPDPEAYNEPGKTPNVKIVEENIEFTGNSLEILPYSIVMYRFELNE